MTLSTVGGIGNYRRELPKGSPSKVQLFFAMKSMNPLTKLHAFQNRQYLAYTQTGRFIRGKADSLAKAQSNQQLLYAEEASTRKRGGHDRIKPMTTTNKLISMPLYKVFVAILDE